MADQKISQLTTIVTVDTAADLFPIVDTSAVETKKITPTALKTALALNNVDNTTDANKPISSATQTELDAKQATLVSGTNIKTINSTSILGSGNIAISSAVAWGGITGTLSTQTDLQTALDTKTNKLITTNRQTASYTLVAGDADKLVEMNVATANNLTVPASVFSAGTQILLAQYGAGQTTIVAGSGVTIRSNGAKLKLNVQYSGATLIFLSATEAYLFGDIVA